MQLQGRPGKRQLTRRSHAASRNGVCGACSAGCGLTLFRTADGKAVDLFGNETHPVNKGALCPRPLTLYAQLQGRFRLKAPAVRNSPGDTWRETEWDAALALVAQRLKSIRAGEILVVGREGDPLDFLCGAEWYAQTQELPIRPSQFFAPAFGDAGSLYRMIGIAGERLLCNTPRDWCASRAILMVGGDLAAENPVTFGPVQDARDRGCEVLYLGARGGMTARRSTKSWIVRPGTEGLALASAIRILLEQGGIDKEFVEEHTSGIDVLQEKLKEYAPDRIAPLAGIDIGSLKDLSARLSLSMPLQIVMGQLPQRRWLDDALLSMCLALIAIKGCIGRPGGGLNILAGTPFSWAGKSEAATVEERLEQGDIKAFIGFGDPLTQLAGQKAREAFKRLPLLVHMGSFDNETRQFSHVSLPCAHQTEYANLAHRSDWRALQWSPRLFPPYGASLPPLEIWRRLMEKTNPDAKAPWGDKPGQAADPRRFADWMLASCPLTAGLNVDDLDGKDDPEKTGGILWPCLAGAQAGDKTFETTRHIRGTIRGKGNILFTAGSAWGDSQQRFPTPGERIHLENAHIPPLPAVAVPEKSLMLVVSMPVDQAADHPSPALHPSGAPGLAARFNRNTADRLDLHDGDPISLSSEFGTARTTVKIAPDIPENIVVLPPETGLGLVAGRCVLRPVSVHVEKCREG